MCDSASGANLPPVDVLRDYETPAEFAEHLHADLVRAINRDYATSTFRPKNVLDAEFVAHVAFAKPLVRVYCGQDHVYAAIEKYALQGFFTPSASGGGGPCYGCSA